MTTLSLRHLTPTIGSEVLDLDLAQADDAALRTLRAALNERMVLVLRDQRLTPERHKEVARHFGTGVLHRHALALKSGGGDPEILPVKADATSKYVAGEGWHTDVSCDPNPIAASLLYVRKCPENEGGDTNFASMYDALTTLSAPIRDMLRGLTAVHDGAMPWRDIYGIEPPPGQPYNRTIHPVIITHPETGRELLWVNGGFTKKINELSLSESQQVLTMLFRHVESTAKIQCRVKWRDNTLVIWDNIATQHMATWDYFPLSRHGERVSAIGPDLTQTRQAA